MRHSASRDVGPGRVDDVVQTTRQHLEVATLRGGRGGHTPRSSVHLCRDESALALRPGTLYPPALLLDYFLS
jgi:hypothetical protein